MSKKIQIPEIFLGYRHEVEPSNLEMSPSVFLNAFSVHLSIGEIFSILPSVRKSTDSKVKAYYEYTSMRNNDTKQKHQIFEKALMVFNNTSVMKFLISGEQDKDNQSTYKKLSEANFTDKIDFNLVPLILFMIIISMYEIYKNGNDFENPVLKYAKIRNSNNKYAEMVRPYIFSVDNSINDFLNLQNACEYVSSTSISFEEYKNFLLSKKNGQMLSDIQIENMWQRIPKFDLETSQNIKRQRAGDPLIPEKRIKSPFEYLYLFINYVLIESWSSEGSTEEKVVSVLKSFSRFVTAHNKLTDGHENDIFLEEIDKNVRKLVSNQDNHLTQSFVILYEVYDVAVTIRNQATNYRTIMGHTLFPSLEGKTSDTHLINENIRLTRQVIIKLLQANERYGDEQKIINASTLNIAMTLNPMLKSLVSELNSLL